VKTETPTMEGIRRRRPRERRRDKVKWHLNITEINSRKKIAENVRNE
jgi:hypothetical protein